MVVLPGEGRVPYVPFERREPAYTGEIVVAREEGIVEEHPFGTFIKLLCEENTGDERFTFGERIYAPGRESTLVEKRDSEAVHILKGTGTFRAWPENVPADQPIQVPLQPGMEIIIGQYVKHEFQNSGTEPLVSVVTICHVDFPAYPHHYPAIFHPGEGNTIHIHDNRVEAFYVIQGPGAMSIADPDNKSIRELTVPAGGVGYKPMYVYHRQYNSGETDEPCYWIHSMVVFTHRGSRFPQLHIRQHDLDGKTPIWESTERL